MACRLAKFLGLCSSIPVKGGAILCQWGGAIVDHLGPKLGIDFISELDWGVG